MAVFVFTDEELRSYHTESDTSSPRLRRSQGCVEIQDPDFIEGTTTRDWLQVTWKEHTGVVDTTANRDAKRLLPDRWLKKEEFPSKRLKPKTTQARIRTLVRRAVNLEFEWKDNGTVVPRFEYIIALAAIEHQWKVDLDSTNEEDLGPIDSEIDGDTGLGYFGLVASEWDQYTSDRGGERVGANPELWRGHALEQVDCAFWLAQRDWQQLELLNPGHLPGNYLPSHLDLLMARIVGPEAAATIQNLVATNMVDPKVKTVLAQHPLSEAVKTRLSRFERLIGPNGGDERVGNFVKALTAELADALNLSYELCRKFAPEVMIVNSSGEQPGYAQAKEQLERWQANENWTEIDGEGRQEAAQYFTNADGVDWNTPPDLTASGEITHWCGLFVAWCVDQWNRANAQQAKDLPNGPAAASSWKAWGDTGISAADDANNVNGAGGIPFGALLLFPRAGKTIGHVGFFNGWEEGVDRDKARLKVIGGNQSDRVTEDLRPRSEVSDIRVFVSPKSLMAEDDLDIFVRTLSGEIRGALNSDLDAISDVAHVIVNRFAHNKRSNGTIRSVCLSNKQFSCWNENDPTNRDNLQHIKALAASSDEYQTLRKIAQDVFEARMTGNSSPRFGANGDQVYHYYKKGSARPDWHDDNRLVHDLDGFHLFFENIAL